MHPLRRCLFKHLCRASCADDCTFCGASSQLEGGLDHLSRHQIVRDYFPIAFLVIDGKWNAFDMRGRSYQHVAGIQIVEFSRWCFELEMHHSESAIWKSTVISKDRFHHFRSAE